jgi:hypothetical protein
MFPIYVNPGLYKDKGRPRIEKLSDPLLTKIYRLQPFATNPNSPESERLWFLRKLSDIDKHQVVHLALAEIEQGAHLRFHVPKGKLVPIEVKGPFDDDAVIARFRCIDVPPDQVDMEGDLTLNVAFGKDSGPAAGFLVAAVVQQLAERVRGILTDFEANFA